MYINDAMLVGGAFQPLHLVQWADLGDLNRVIGAPNHLQRATVPTPGTPTEVQVPDGCIERIHNHEFSRFVYLYLCYLFFYLPGDLFLVGIGFKNFEYFAQIFCQF